MRTSSPSKRTFASDNYAGVHPEIMNALHRANTGHAPSYGADRYTKKAIEKFNEFFGADAEVFFVYNGTGANVLGLSALTRSFNSIICPDLSHINVDESTAPEKFTGCKLVTIATRDGKIYPAEVAEKIQRLGDQHHPQASVLSVSQSTEYGTVYTVEELKALAVTARKYNLAFHMDGSRIANAAVSLNKDFRTFTSDIGVDILSFGGTKNGLMFGEAIVFLDPVYARQFKYIRKQGMQLHSKGRFIGAQFDALMSNDLWKRNATHANKMAKLMEHGLRQVPQLQITQSVDANAIFFTLPPASISPLQDEYFFYVWNEKTSEARLMCSFDTTEEDVQDFIEKVKEIVN